VNKPPLFVFCPLPPSRNGIADYNAEICLYLSEHYALTCVISDDAPDPIVEFEASVLTVSAYEKSCADARCERHLFHLGNNMGHAYMLPWLERVSGLVTVHDPSMTHLVNAVVPGGWKSDPFAMLVEQAHGQSGLAMLATAKDASVWVNALAQEIDFLSLFVRDAKAVVVHSNLASRRVRADCPKMDVHVIPHFAKASGRKTPEAEPTSTVSLLCLGFVARAKRIDLVLGALARALDDGLSVRLVIAGEVRPEEYDVEADVMARGLADHVTLTGYVDSAEMGRLIEDADIVVNLRDPTSGETSGTLMRAFAAARCTVVTDVGTYAELPDDCVVKLPSREMSESGLYRVLKPLVSDTQRRVSIGARAQHYAHVEASLDRVGTAYRDAIEQAYAVRPAAQIVSRQSWEFIPPVDTPMIEEAALASGADDEAAQLWWRDRLLPLGDPSGKLVVLGGGHASCDLAHGPFDWGVVQHFTDASRISRFEGELVNADAALLLLHGPEPVDIVTVDRFVAILSKGIAAGGSVTVDCPYAVGWWRRLDDGLRRAGFVRVVERVGPSLPVIRQPRQKWCALSWGATYGRLMA